MRAIQLLSVLVSVACCPAPRDVIITRVVRCDLEVPPMPRAEIIDGGVCPPGYVCLTDADAATLDEALASWRLFTARYLARCGVIAHPPSTAR